MKTHATITALLLIALWTPQAFLAQSKAPLSDDDVIQMVSDGFPDEVVIGSIAANEVNFDASLSSLLTLKKANISDKVIEAMLSAEAKKRSDTHAATATQQVPANFFNMSALGAKGVPTRRSPISEASAQLPKVTLLIGDQRLPMQPSSTEIANSKGKGGSKAGSVFKGFGKGMIMATQMAGAPVPTFGGRGGAMPGAAYTWALPGRNSQSVLPTAMPSFELEFSDIVGIDPDAYEPVVVKLIQTRDNWRLVETSKDRFDKHGNDTRSTKTEGQTPIKVTSLERGHLLITPIAELMSGEYGLVLHPKKNHKELAGVSEPNVESLFTSVWDFSISEAKTASGTPLQNR